MKITSYLKKAINILYMRVFCHQEFIYPNLYVFNLTTKQLVNSRKILFNFASTEFMHLGDHLFFIPLIKSFIASGFTVTVATYPFMSPLLNKLGIDTITKLPDCSQYDITISRIEMIGKLPSVPQIIVHVSQNLTMPICDALVASFKQLFPLLDYQPMDYYSIIDDSIMKRFNLSSDKPIVIINFFCDASAFLITRKKISRIMAEVTKYANSSEYQLLMLGSLQDKLNDKLDYNFSFIDLRGQTSIIDVFSLIAAKNVCYYIGFDTFIMHVFSLLHKQSLVLFRGRLTKNKQQMLEKHHVNLFKQDNFVKLLPL